MCDGIHSGPLSLNLFFGLRIAAHSSLQKVFEPWQLAAMLFQSSLQSECKWALLATGHRRGMDRLVEVAGFGPSSLLRESHARRMARVHCLCSAFYSL
jgi:hypothetical protein